MKRIILIGFMGAGKTTVGKKLAESLSCPFVDTDEWIEKEQGKKISDIFEKEGEQAFREMETECLKHFLRSDKSFVLSVGGGMPVKEENRELLRKIGRVVYLKTSKEEIIRRVSSDTSRPLLQGGTLEEKVESLMAVRESIYMEVAQLVVYTDGKDIEQLVKELKQYKEK